MNPVCNFSSKQDYIFKLYLFNYELLKIKTYFKYSMNSRPLHEKLDFLRISCGNVVFGKTFLLPTFKIAG